MAKRKPLIPGVAKPSPTDIAKMKGEVDMKNAPAPAPAPVAPDVKIDMAEAEGIEPQPKKPEPITPPASEPIQPIEPVREPIEEKEPEPDPVATAKQIVGRVEELQLEQMRLMTILRRMMEGQ